MLNFATLVIFLLAALFFYAFYSLIKRAFEEVGFNNWESSTIVFGSVILGI